MSSRQAGPRCERGPKASLACGAVNVGINLGTRGGGS